MFSSMWCIFIYLFIYSNNFFAFADSCNFYGRYELIIDNHGNEQTVNLNIPGGRVDSCIRQFIIISEMPQDRTDRRFPQYDIKETYNNTEKDNGKKSTEKLIRTQSEVVKKIEKYGLVFDTNLYGHIEKNGAHYNSKDSNVLYVGL